MSKIILDLDFVKEYLSINETELSKVLNIPRSSLHNWRNNKSNISNNQHEKIYSFIYDQGIRLNRIKSQLYKDKENSNSIILYHGAKKGIKENINYDRSFEKQYELYVSFVEKNGYKYDTKKTKK